MPGRDDLRPEDVDAAVAELAASLGAAVVTTLGPEGLRGSARRPRTGRRAGACRAPGYAVSAVDTTGAGDVQRRAGGSLARGEALDAAVGYAMGAAALSVTKLGAQSGMPYAREVEAFWQNTQPEAERYDEEARTIPRGRQGPLCCVSHFLISSQPATSRYWQFPRPSVCP